MEASMNDPMFPHQRTDIYQASLALVRSARPIKHALLRDQAERAAISTLLAIGEGLPHDGPRMRRQYFARAKASVCEVVTRPMPRARAMR
jgi:four helix bundle protein